MRQAEVTALLLSAEGGDAGALERVLPLIYEELQEIARRHLGRERAGHTLTPTALVHEAYLKLVDQTRVQWRGRGQFLGVAALAMRRILVNHARDRKRLKRGGNAPRLSLTAGLEVAVPGADEDDDVIIRIDALLERLAEFDPRAARVVECRYFAGLDVDETAAALGLGTATVKRDWALARAWLRRELATKP
ncbi:MAG TPA: sigma-70 family RNA polymerase sigma factor [Candidatus Krumholzibacteria bacterium]|nr:sigma-70 family RNA polymerase sigma factor [Candidatus Krumholzibacteria bacterium]